MKIKYCIYYVLVAFLVLKPLILLSYDRVISLSPQVTESIYLLGAEKVLIANTVFCKRPQEATRKEKIGTPLRPDIEKIVSLAPDLVIGACEGNQMWFIERIKKLGINTFVFKRPKNFKELSSNFYGLAEILKKEETAKKLIKETEDALNKNIKKRQFRVMWQVGSDPVVVATKASFVNDIIEYAGGKNIIEADVPYSRINMEEVIQRNPQIIVLMDMGYNIEKEEKRWKTYLKDTRFVILDPYVASSPTPVTFLEAVNRLKEGYDRFFN